MYSALESTKPGLGSTPWWSYSERRMQMLCWPGILRPVYLGWQLGVWKSGPAEMWQWMLIILGCSSVGEACQQSGLCSLSPCWWFRLHSVVISGLRWICFWLVGVHTHMLQTQRKLPSITLKCGCCVVREMWLSLFLCGVWLGGEVSPSNLAPES